ncbi:MAG: rRNA maturation protein [Methanosarcinaceae archaeon]|nr:rRNA maturation protein [Methanosarcinaceae archaeon]MDD4497802.1 rRNA maturation protein [Methanosarcinaceae archaeon]
MFVTSSRKPSAKTRTFCKKLSQFTTFRYVSRGKTGLRELLDLAEGEAFLVVGEYHGNPGSLGFHGFEGQLLFSLRFSDASLRQDSAYLPRKLPIITGSGELAEALVSYLPFERVKDSSSLPKGSRVLVVDEEILDFREGESSVLKLKLKGFKGYDEAEKGSESGAEPEEGKTGDEFE